MIQVLERFHKIADHVADDPERPRSLSELAKLIGVSLPACSNIVRTMVQLGYLQSLGERKGYILGSTPYRLTRNGPFKKRLCEKARPVMEELSREFKEMLVLVAECNGRRAELLRFEGESLIQVKELPSEARANLFGCSTGIVLLSHMDEERVKRLWDARPEAKCIGGAAGFEEFQKLRSEAREKGRFISEPPKGEDPLNESVTFAFPVFEDGKVCAAIGSRVPAYRFAGERRALMLSSFKAAAAKIGESLSKS